MKKLNTKIFEIIIIFLLSLTPTIWLRSNEVILGHDSGFRIHPFNHLVRLFYSWNPNINFGTDWTLFKGLIVTQLPETIFTGLTQSVHYGQILTFIFWFFLIGLSIYLFVNAFFGEGRYWFLRLFTSIFYMYNFFLLQGWFIAERAKFSLYAALPLGLTVIYKTLHGQYSLLKGTMLFSFIFLFLNGGGSPPLYGAIVLTYATAFFYVALISLRSGNKQALIHVGKTALVFVIGIITVNAYWIWPQLNLFLNHYADSLISMGGFQGILAWEAVVSKNSSFLNLLRFQGISDWYGNAFHQYAQEYLNNPLLVLMSFVPMFILLLGLWNLNQGEKGDRRLPLVYLMLFIFFIGLIFTAGSHPPLGFLYVLFIQRIPGFAIFRSAFYKFGPAVWFSGVFLTGYFLNLLIQMRVSRKWLASGFRALALVAIVAYHYPFFASNFFLWNKPFSTKVHIPEYVTQMSDYINLHATGNSRMLLLPPLDSSFAADSYAWGFWSLDLLPRLVIDTPVVANDSKVSLPELLYDYLKGNNTSEFLRLAGRLHIDKVLVRDDVLYNDKLTTSQSLSAYEDNLRLMPGVSLERQIAKWRLYSLTVPDFAPIFYVPDVLAEVNTKFLTLDTLISDGYWSSRSAVVYNDQLINKNNAQVNAFVSRSYVQAECIMCIPDEFQNRAGGIQISSVRLLPDSKFYSLVRVKEEKQVNRVRDIPTQRIDADLGLATKRLAELSAMVIRESKSESDAMTLDTIERYKQFIEDALNQTALLHEDQRNQARIKVLSYLVQHRTYLSALENKRRILEDDFDKLSFYIHDKTSAVENQTWMSRSADDLKYSFILVEDGKYDIHVSQIPKSPLKVLLDGAEIKTFDGVNLSKGIHTMELWLPKPDDLLQVLEASAGGELTIHYGEKISYGIKDFNPQRKYAVSFDYKILNGRAPTFVISQYDNQNKTTPVAKSKTDLESQSNIWKTVNQTFTPISSADKAVMEFYISGFGNKESVVLLNNFKVYNFSVPSIFLTKDVPIASGTVPQITYTTINPTEYVIHIDHATDPYLLVFNQSFDTGWRAYVSSPYYGQENTRMPRINYADGDAKEPPNDYRLVNNYTLKSFFHKPIDEANHIPVNGFGNAWIINQTGSYDIYVDFIPQNIFILSMAASGLAVVVLIGLYILKR